MTTHDAQAVPCSQTKCDLINGAPRAARPPGRCAVRWERAGHDIPNAARPDHTSPQPKFTMASKFIALLLLACLAFSGAVRWVASLRSFEALRGARLGTNWARAGCWEPERGVGRAARACFCGGRWALRVAPFPIASLLAATHLGTDAHCGGMACGRCRSWVRDLVRGWAAARHNPAFKGCIWAWRIGWAANKRAYVRGGAMLLAPGARGGRHCSLRRMHAALAAPCMARMPTQRSSDDCAYTHGMPHIHCWPLPLLFPPSLQGEPGRGPCVPLGAHRPNSSTLLTHPVSSPISPSTLSTSALPYQSPFWLCELGGTLSACPSNWHILRRDTHPTICPLHRTPTPAHLSNTTASHLKAA